MGEKIGDNNGVKGGGKVEVEDEEVVLPGFRFHPTDEELVEFYLRRKIQRRRFSLEIIKEIDIYKYDPWELPRAGILGEKEWYFFCLRGRKYRNSIRPNRVTGSGFWKATGIDRPIHSSRNPNECIGLKKSLVYYQGSAGKGTKTDWMMHEYRLPSTPDCIQEAEVWTVCRIIKRSASLKRFKKQQQFEQLNWKEANESFDSSTKSNSLESEWGEENKNLDLNCYRFQHDERFVGNCLEEEMVELSGYGDWSADEQVSSWTWRPESSNADEIFSEGSWDEIGRTVDYMTEAASSYDLVFY